MADNVRGLIVNSLHQFYTNIEDSLLPSTTAEDSGKVLTVNAEGEYVLAVSSGGGGSGGDLTNYVTKSELAEKEFVTGFSLNDLYNDIDTLDTVVSYVLTNLSVSQNSEPSDTFLSENYYTKDEVDTALASYDMSAYITDSYAYVIDLINTLSDGYTYLGAAYTYSLGYTTKCYTYLKSCYSYASNCYSYATNCYSYASYQINELFNGYTYIINEMTDNELVTTYALTDLNNQISELTYRISNIEDRLDTITELLNNLTNNS